MHCFKSTVFLMGLSWMSLHCGATQQAQMRESEYIQSERNLRYGASNPPQLAGGDTKQGCFSGNVLQKDHMQTPIADAEILIEHGAEQLAHTRTNASGEFGLCVDVQNAKGQTPDTATVTLRIDHEDYRTVLRTVQWHSGKTQALTVYLEGGCPP